MSTSQSALHAVAYYRHSVPNEGLLIQQLRVRQWARLHHVHIVHEFVDERHLAIDGPALPGFTQMLTWLNEHADVGFVLCADSTRLRRFPGQAASIISSGKQVISVATTHFAPSGPPVLDP